MFGRGLFPSPEELGLNPDLEVGKVLFIESGAVTRSTGPVDPRSYITLCFRCLFLLMLKNIRKGV